MDKVAWEVAQAILVSLGSAAAIVFALSKWLGELIAKRILQNEQSALMEALEGVKQEFLLARSSYEKHSAAVVEYFELFYGTYRKCQKAAGMDIIRHPERGDVNTKDAYIAQADQMAEDWERLQARVRLLLPRRALELHIQIIDELNKFKELVRAHDRTGMSPRDELKNSFKTIHGLKEELEQSLRQHLRVDATTPHV